ncbi:MAG TPA: helix-turn-helix domain-containing protein [Amycolatopsis sp.]|nr:helix-turn-helix domain-containing protein [Amycolatopsis sp.]
MPEEVKRRYHSPTRAEAARRTRAVIREAGARLFAEQGYVSTTMRQIADAAGVAPRTVFATFPGGKAEVFSEALNVAVAGDELPIAQADRPAFRESLDDPEHIIDVLVTVNTDLLDRAGKLIMTTVESAGADLDMRRFADEGAQATATNMRTVANALDSHGLLRDGITAEAAGDVLFTLCSPHVHALLRAARGWSPQRYREWLRTTITTTLLR